MRCTCDGCLKQRTGNCLLNCFKSLVITFALSDTNMSNSFICHNCLYIGKVKVYKSRLNNKVGNTLNALAKNIICYIKRIEKSNLLLGYLL